MKTVQSKSVSQLNMGGPVGVSKTWVCVNNNHQDLCGFLSL